MLYFARLILKGEAVPSFNFQSEEESEAEMTPRRKAQKAKEEPLAKRARSQLVRQALSEHSER